MVTKSLKTRLGRVSSLSTRTPLRAWGETCERGDIQTTLEAERFNVDRVLHADVERQLSALSDLHDAVVRLQ